MEQRVEQALEKLVLIVDRAEGIERRLNKEGEDRRERDTERAKGWPVWLQLAVALLGAAAGAYAAVGNLRSDMATQSGQVTEIINRLNGHDTRLNRIDEQFNGHLHDHAYPPYQSK